MDCNNQDTWTTCKTTEKYKLAWDKKHKCTCNGKCGHPKAKLSLSENVSFSLAENRVKITSRSSLIARMLIRNVPSNVHFGMVFSGSYVMELTGINLN